jgi:predicted glycosyltransferase
MSMIRQDRPVRFIDFSSQFLDYMAAADVVVSMGGYNTLAEILALERRALVVPRAGPSFEQVVRARLFERRGLIRVLHSDQLSPNGMAEALLDALQAPPPSRQAMEALGFDFTGLLEVKAHVLRLLGGRGLLPPPPR